MRKYNIFCPEYVPMNNKGEEAIIRGIADVLFPEGNCDIHLLDNVDNYIYQDGIHVYPSKWFFPLWMNREFGLGLSYEKIRDSASSVFRNGLHKLWPGWVKRKSSPLAKSEAQMKLLANGQPPSNERERRLKQITACDFVVAGHDGALNEIVCQLIDLMRDIGVPCGIFGLEMSAPFRSKAIAEIHHKTLRHCKFFYCRTAATVQNIKNYFPEIQVELLPDPAFGMRAAPDETIDRIIAEEDLGTFFMKPVVMCTSCEPAPIARYCFEEIKRPGAKLAAHRQLFAELIQYVTRNYDANILFLPHATGPGKALDDRVIANEIIQRSGLSTDRARLLSPNCSARVLKGLIKRAHLLIAERLHSMIGATSAHTPFLCLGSNTDKRIKGIIVDMLGMGNNVYFLNRPSLDELKNKFNETWENRANIERHLMNITAKNNDLLAYASAKMRSFITAKGDR
jgi:polysaccharide pyruvyl transferase WcaK-like protein